ncbi:hypothetical protein [Azohydromonas australica]|uniref:pirin family protein n=1 Tax=Azohydromonas australica TaxID=364039 RepID=UPI0003F5BA5A|nr:hypothetical protein [Azohydromonas australica]
MKTFGQFLSLLLRARWINAITELGLRCAHTLAPGRFGWLQLLEGVVEVDAEEEVTTLELRGGDALQLSTVCHLTLRPTTVAAWLWFDLP